MQPIYSLVIPLKNEANNIAALINELEPIMNHLGEAWELICIDDGSTDHTRQVLHDLLQYKAYLRAIIFKKNYGQSSAFDAGFKASQGKFVITLDGDGQNDPKDIPQLIQFIEDCDLVCGIRLKREDSLTKRFTSKWANIVRRWLCEDGVQDSGCSLKVYRKTALEQIKMFDGMHRFLPALFKIEGFRIQQMAVNHRKRWGGKSHYHFFNRSFNTLADLWAVHWMKKRRLHYQIETELRPTTPP